MPRVPRSPDAGPRIAQFGVAPESVAAGGQQRAAAIRSGFGALGQAGTQTALMFQQRLEQQRIRNEVMERSTEFSRRANEVRLELMRNPGDPATMLERYQTQADEILSEITQDLDGEVGSRVNARALTVFDTQIRAVGNAAFQLERDVSFENDEQALEEAVSQGSISEPATRIEIRAQLEDDLRANGFNSEARVVDTMAEFDRRVQTNQMTTAVRGALQEENPELARQIASDTETYPNVRAEDRVSTMNVIDTRARTLESAKETASRRRQTERADRYVNLTLGRLDALKLAVDEARTPEERAEAEMMLQKGLQDVQLQLPDAAQVLSRTQFAALSGALEGARVVTDDTITLITAQNMMQEGVDDPSEIQEYLDLALANKNMTVSTYNSFSGVVRRFGTADKPPTAVQIELARLRAAGKPGMADKDAQARALRLAEAEKRFWRFIRDNPDAGFEQLTPQVDGLIREMALSDSSLTRKQTALLPASLQEALRKQGRQRFDIADGDIDRAEELLLDMQDRGEVTEEEANREFERLQEWRTIVIDEKIAQDILNRPRETP